MLDIICKRQINFDKTLITRDLNYHLQIYFIKTPCLQIKRAFSVSNCNWHCRYNLFKCFLFKIAFGLLSLAVLIQSATVVAAF